MSVWTSNYAIMRDLSKAQGRLVPVDVNSTVMVAVAANEKPPQLATEETEEEFYDTFASGDFDYSTTPDFSLIQQMLEMVKDGDGSSENSEGDMLQITKVNALPETKKRNKSVKSSKKADVKVLDKGKKKEESKVNTNTLEEKMPSGDAPVKKKKMRNVAMASLLEKENNNEPIKLLKPTDFITSKAVIESVRKVDEWFSNDQIPIQKSMPSLTSVVMFKKKSSKCLSEKSDTQSEKENDALLSPVKNTGIFRPSPKADVYYQKYLEKSQLQNSIKEDIWQKAERLMTEADAKKAALAELPTEDDSSTNVEHWILLDPRHKVDEKDDCVVCATVRKHGYNIDDIPLDKK